MLNGVDPDQTLHYAASSDLGLQCLLRSVYPNIRGKHDIRANSTVKQYQTHGVQIS